MSRLTAERLQELYVGTLTLVAERGYDNLTMDQVAEATRSSKATLYRQWGSKAALVVEALTCMGDADNELPDTGSLRGDLRAIAARKDHSENETELITAILHAMRQNKELAEAVRTQIIEPGRERLRTMLQRAVDRGEVAPDCPALPYADLLFMSPLVLGALLAQGPPSPDYLRDYFDGVLLPALGIH